MSSRLTFRPRPLDIHKKLPIVKSVKDLDSDEGVSRTVHHNHIALDAENELVLPTPSKRGGGAEIPTPNFEVVDSYERDYTRSFNHPPSYLRGRGARSEAAEYVEYDLDDEDEDWLQQYNAERRILPHEKFEWMLYKMELMDHKARERAGGMPVSQSAQLPVLLSHDVAVKALQIHSSRFAVLDAVYEYWKSKRDRWQKPILRRLQPPPPVNDTNPFNVFRPREKVHRPHTRRMQRRENDILSFDKLRQVRRNLEQSRNLIMALQKREEKKRDLLECEAKLQRVQIILKHDSRVDDGLMATNASVYTPRKFPLSKWGEDGGSNIGSVDHSNGYDGSLQPLSELCTPAADVAVGDPMDRTRHKRKRRRLPPLRGRPMRRIKVMDSLEPVLLFTKPLDAEKLAAAGIIPQIESPTDDSLSGLPSSCHGRIGRGGRIIFDRWNPLCRTSVGVTAFPFTPQAPLISHPTEMFNGPPSSRVDIDPTVYPNVNSAVAIVVDHTSSTNALHPQF